jgi:hypothetical protein
MRYVLPKVSVDGADTGKWYMMAVEGKVSVRAGYCAATCDGHGTKAEALEHFLQYQLDREVDLWLSRRDERACDICGAPTILRARLGRKTALFVLCQRHHSTTSLQELARRSITALPIDSA